MDLITDAGKWAGAIRIAQPGIAGDSPYPRGTTCEVVEISAGEVQDQDVEMKSFDEWHHHQCPRRKGLYEFYNVLWVEWVDGVAYRKCLGRVEKSVWEEIAKDDIDLTLG